MAGGTWNILIQEGRSYRPTQSTVVGGRPSGSKPKIATKETIGASKNGKNLVQTGIVVGAAIAKTGFNQYYSITGQGAQRNRVNTSMVYGAAVVSIAVQLGTGNFVGAAVTTIGTGVALGNQYFNFQKDITDQNAMAEYLRQQSGTSVSANRGEFFNFKFR